MVKSQIASLLLVMTLTGCAAFSDIIGLNYDSEQEFRQAVDSRVDKRQLDPVLAGIVKTKAYELWVKDRSTVLDSYELDEAIKALVIASLTDS